MAMRSTARMILLTESILILMASFTQSLAQTRSSTSATILAVPVNCHGLSMTTLTVEDGKPKSSVAKSSDKMRIVRHNRTLAVVVNGEEGDTTLDPEIKKALQEPDIYTITSETREGLASILSESLYPTVHTLVIDPSGTKALWTESTLWWTEPIGRPTSTTVLFTCDKSTGKAR